MFKGAVDAPLKVIKYHEQKSENYTVITPLMILQVTMYRHIQNPIKRLRWNFFAKIVTVKSR